MGDIASLTGLIGLIGLAVTSGMLVAEGVAGTIVFVASVVVLLTQKPDWGGAIIVTGAALAVILVLAIVRTLINRRLRATPVRQAGRAADDPALAVEQRRIATSERRARLLSICAVTITGAAAGYGWAEWNEMPFSFIDAEAITGLVIGMVAAAVGGHAANLFMRGSLRAGGSAAVVGAVIIGAAYALNALAVYVPFAGVISLLLAAMFSLRLGRREKARYKGLRILS